jgi:hypothetical protein
VTADSYPPRARLQHTLRSLAQALPVEMASLLEGARFSDGVAALRRLSEEGYLQEAVAELSNEEAAWLAELLFERWSRIQTPHLLPAVALVVPEEIWLGDRPARIDISIATSGIASDYEALWHGADAVPGAKAKAVAMVEPFMDDGPRTLAVTVRVRARVENGGQRCLLSAEARVALRRPRVMLAADRGELFVVDQTGRPGKGVTVEIGGARVMTNGEGKAAIPPELGASLEAGAPIRVEQVLAGRLGGKG